MKHKHAELIKAWADGAEIERKEIYCRYEYNSQVDEVKEQWVFDGNPRWSYTEEYRIRSEPKPDVIGYLNQLNLISGGNRIWEQSNYYITKNCIKLIFDGETGELKSAEVLK